jgi:hypothetical protein
MLICWGVQPGKTKKLWDFGDFAFFRAEKSRVFSCLGGLKQTCDIEMAQVKKKTHYINPPDGNPKSLFCFNMYWLT